ncbi:hypothetical protein HK096_007302 [Nowakowskiella sp. JEL0078]|nr:hypothetical protein HK096_007302 [Nowakowskiella sp. JEL0078]
MQESANSQKQQTSKPAQLLRVPPQRTRLTRAPSGFHATYSRSSFLGLCYAPFGSFCKFKWASLKVWHAISG